MRGTALGEREDPQEVVGAVVEAATARFDICEIRHLNAYAELDAGVIMAKAGDGSFSTARWVIGEGGVTFEDVKTGLVENEAMSDHNSRCIEALTERWPTRA